MNIIKKYFIVVLFGLVFPTAQYASASSLNVVTTTEDLAAITREIGGELITVESITRGNQDAHYVEAKPSYMLIVNRADLLIYQGLDLEENWLPLLIRGARNPDILPGKPGLLNVSSAITPIDVPVGEIDRSMGDIHPLGNPHYHLDPVNGLLLANLISERLSLINPENAERYQKNRNQFHQRLEEAIKSWSSRLKPYSNRKVVTYHSTWNYFLRRFGLISIATVETRPGVPPSAKHLASLGETMLRENIQLILQANYFDTHFSELLAQKAKGKVISLPTSVGGSPEATDYFRLFDTLVTCLENGFQN